MSEENHATKPLQTRRGDLILPPSDSNDRDSKRPKKQYKLGPTKKAGLFAQFFLILLIPASFALLLLSDVLWTDYDLHERSSFQSTETWQEAWTLQAIRSHDPISTSSYFWEQSIPLPPAATHRGINIFLHIVAAFLLLKCLEALKAPAAYAATLVFSIHPAVLQTLFWPGYRNEIIGLIVLLLALLAGIRNRGSLGYLATVLFTTLACLIHPAGITIPVILTLVIILQKKSLKLPDFNRVLPLICIALFIGVWTQNEVSTSDFAQNEEVNVIKVTGESMFFFTKQALFPVNVSLFHPTQSGIDYTVGAGYGLLPFLFYIPFFTLALLNCKKKWAQAGLLGLTTFILLSLYGINQAGAFLDGQRAFENHGMYIGLPAITALVICGLGFITRIIGPIGKLLWVLGFSLLLLIQLGITGMYAYTVGSPIRMWQEMTEQWTDSWVPKAALIDVITETGDQILSEDDQINMLTAVLDARPDLIEERKMLARIYKNLGQNNNALREYKRILRDNSPDNEFLEEAARFYDKVGLTWDASNARERKQR